MSFKKGYFGDKDKQSSLKEEEYRPFQRLAWAEHKRKERENKCRDAQGKRCKEICSQCDKQRTGSTLSLERLAEESGYEPSDTVDIAELVTYGMLLQDLSVILAELEPENRKILELFSIGKSEREIAKDIGLSQKGVNKRKTKLFVQLRKRLEIAGYSNPFKKSCGK